MRQAGTAARRDMSITSDTGGTKETARLGRPPISGCADYSDAAARSDRLAHPVTGPAAWRGCDVDPASCVLKLDDDALDEIRALADRIRAAPHPVLLRSPDDHRLDAVRKVFARARGNSITESGSRSSTACPSTRSTTRRHGRCSGRSAAFCLARSPRSGTARCSTT